MAGQDRQHGGLVLVLIRMAVGQALKLVAVAGLLAGMMIVRQGQGQKVVGACRGLRRKRWRVRPSALRLVAVFVWQGDAEGALGLLPTC